MRATWAAAFVAALLVPFSACTKKQDDGNLMVFHYSYRDDAKTLDPANAYDYVSSDVVGSIYETLYQYAYLSDGYKVVPLLAADMPRYSADRLTVTIPVRQEIRYQDDPCFKETSGRGRALRAHDFVYALKRLALPSVDSQGWWIVDGRIQGINDFHDKLVNTPRGDLPKVFAEPVAGIRALDDHTLQLKLTKPYPQLMYALAMTFTAPVPSEAVTAYGGDSGTLTEHPVGTGPFVLKSWEKGRSITLDRNPGYHPEFYPTESASEYRQKGFMADAGKPVPFLDRVALDIVADYQPAWISFTKGLQDVITLPKDRFEQAIVNRTELAATLAQRGVKLSIETGVSFSYLSFNMKDRLIGGNTFLRQAISSAIDREKWIAVYTGGTGVKATTVLPPGVADRPPQSKDAKLKFDYNPNRARELLTRAGYPEGRGLPTINFDLRGATALDRQLGPFFADSLAAVGIKVNLIYNTFPAYLAKMKGGNYQVGVSAWGMDYPDPENVFQLFYGQNQAPTGPGETGFDQPAMNHLYEKMAVMDPGPKRAELIKQMDDIVQEQLPWALGYYHTTYELAQPWVLDYRASELVPKRFKYYRVNRDVKKRYLESGG